MVFCTLHWHNVHFHWHNAHFVRYYLSLKLWRQYWFWSIEFCSIHKHNIVVKVLSNAPLRLWSQFGFSYFYICFYLFLTISLTEFKNLHTCYSTHMTLASILIFGYFLNLLFCSPFLAISLTTFKNPHICHLTLMTLASILTLTNSILFTSLT